MPTVRARDGLALSSRNVYLSARDRATAPLLQATLQTCAAAIRAGEAISTSLETAHAALHEAGFAVDYLEAREPDTLQPLREGARAGRILAAARLGRTRLLDNVAIEAKRTTHG